MCGIGFVEDRNVFIDYYRARGQYDLTLAMVADLIDLKAAVIRIDYNFKSVLVANARGE